MGPLSGRALPACLLLGALLASCPSQEGLAEGLDSPDATQPPALGTDGGAPRKERGRARPAAAPHATNVEQAADEPAPAEIVAGAGATADGTGAGWGELERVLATMPWVEPFLHDDVFRRVVLVAYFINPNSVDAGDLDGDGDLDLLCAQTERDRVVFFPQILPGSFLASPIVVAATSLTQSPVAVAADDVDGDGTVDVVSYNGATDDIAIFHQIGFGVFERTPIVLRAPGRIGAWSVEVSDLDGDGDADVAARDPKGAVLAAFEQIAPDTFVHAPHLQ